LTFFAAEAAGRDARVEHLAHDLVVRARSAGSKRRCRGTDIRPIQIQANALTQLGDPLFGKTPGRTTTGVNAGP
jgi:hypothetical protein